MGSGAAELDRYLAIVIVEWIKNTIRIARSIIDNTHIASDPWIIYYCLTKGIDRYDREVGL